MEGRMNGRIGERAGGERPDSGRRTDRRAGGRVCGRADGWTHAETDGWKNGRT